MVSGSWEYAIVYSRPHNVLELSRDEQSGILISIQDICNIQFIVCYHFQ